MSRFRYTLLINWFIDWLIHWRLIFEESSLQNWSFIGDGDTEAPGESRAGEVPPSLVPVFLKKYFINSNLLFNSVIWQHDSIESKTVPFKKNIAMLYGEGTYFEGRVNNTLIWKSLCIFFVLGVPTDAGQLMGDQILES